MGKNLVTASPVPRETVRKLGSYKYNVDVLFLYCGFPFQSFRLKWVYRTHFKPHCYASVRWKSWYRYHLGATLSVSSGEPLIEGPCRTNPSFSSAATLFPPPPPIFFFFFEVLLVCSFDNPNPSTECAPLNFQGSGDLKGYVVPLGLSFLSVKRKTKYNPQAVFSSYNERIVWW